MNKYKNIEELADLGLSEEMLEDAIEWEEMSDELIPDPDTGLIEED